ncbi:MULTISPECIES: LysR family transcriptional regulator [unclassified Knoellia]|uniref:LysR family transcriptional regulator n=1 Tax=Knoellia altitudinis TaxID=3404795 RepID=UPI003614B139
MDVLTTTECSLLAEILRCRSMRSAAKSVGLTRASAVRLVHRLESKNSARLVSSGPGSPSLTAQGQLLLRASMDLHGSLGTFAAATPLDRCAIRIASSLESHMDVDPLARLDPPLVVDVTETDSAHAIELFDGGSTEALAAWDVPGAPRPTRDSITIPLFDEDLWIVGRDVPGGVRSVKDLPEDLTWVATASQAALLASLLQIPADSPQMLVVESRHAHRILILSGRAAGLIPASHRAAYEGLGLTHVRTEGLTRTAVLHTDHRCEVRHRLGEIQAMFQDHSRRMARPPVAVPAAAPLETLPPHSLELGDVFVLRAIERHGSLNRAATELCLTQPALTRRLRRLEERVGTHLVVRTATGSSLTDSATALVRRVDGAVARFQTSVAAARPGVHLTPMRAPREALCQVV